MTERRRFVNIFKASKLCAPKKDTLLQRRMSESSPEMKDIIRRVLNVRKNQCI